MELQSKAARDRLDKLLGLIRQAKRPAVQAYWISRYCASYDARLEATVEAHARMRPDRRPSEAALPIIAGELVAWKKTNEPVLLHWLPKKSSSGHRPVLEFGIKIRALQLLLHTALAEVLDLHACQCLLHGGTHEAIKRTVKAMNDGYVWAVEIDISNCYQSFDGNKLIKLLPITKKMTENIVLTRHLHLVPSQTWHVVGHDDDPEGSNTFKAVPSSARRGIPQGSALSPLIAEAMIAIALKHFPMLGCIIAYADNVLLLAKTKSDVESMTEALLAALKAHPVGRLRPKPKNFQPGEPVIFLGHRLTMKNGVVRIAPDDENMQEFESCVKSEIAHLGEAGMETSGWHERVEELKNYIRSWTANFKLCDGIKKTESYWLAHLQALCEEKLAKIMTYKTFKLHPDQKENVEAALKHCKAKTGTAFDTVALDWICTQYMATGIAFADYKAALTAERKKSGSAEKFLGKVVEFCEELVPEYVVTVTQKEKLCG